MYDVFYVADDYGIVRLDITNDDKRFTVYEIVHGSDELLDDLESKEEFLYQYGQKYYESLEDYKSNNVKYFRDHEIFKWKG